MNAKKKPKSSNEIASLAKLKSIVSAKYYYKNNNELCEFNLIKVSEVYFDLDVNNVHDFKRIFFFYCFFHIVIHLLCLFQVWNVVHYLPS